MSRLGGISLVTGDFVTGDFVMATTGFDQRLGDTRAPHAPRQKAVTA